jgi:hypothetical protein
MIMSVETHGYWRTARTSIRCKPLSLGMSLKFERTSENAVELRGFEPLTFCMPCSMVSSDDVVLGPVAAVQSNSNVRGRLARSGAAWGRCHLVCHLLSGPPKPRKARNGSSHHRRNDDAEDR